MDRFEAMSVLLAVVEAGSLSAGARRLGQPLATVSRKVADLERHLHTRLLVRTSRRIGLTDAGRAYVAASKRILEQVEEAERTASGEYREPRGELNVTAPIVFGRRHLLPIALEFLAAHAEIDLRLLLIDRSVALHEEHIDLALRIGVLDDSTLVATRVGSIRRVLCASPDYLARRGTPRTPEDLAGHDGIEFRGTPADPDWRHSRGVAVPRVRLAVNTAEAAVDAAVAGLGITRLLSYQVADEVRSGALVPVLEPFGPAPVPVSLVYPEQGMLPLKVRAFLDWAAPRLRARLASPLHSSP
ncbi:LysR family transcriptional regulator [Skermanella rosea]|uniref:LysR family transcriptional regulator n=1 Tax=Skermanella rosea TaxID=1817965 RepID=UPI001934AB31|nr:LysR family transcriptional regulator [Skermanella rosea]UEM03050.1 LysR family transcriptional regulator [Skermanella rosea]